MNIQRIISGELEENAYIISDEETNEAFIIDPGYKDERYVKTLKESGVDLKGILITHYHSDHTGGIDLVKSAYDVPIYVHEEDRVMEASSYGAGVLLKDGDEITLGRYKLMVMHTPGHSRGSVCYYVENEDIVFTGDTIFNVDLGATCFRGGSAEDMKDSCIRVVNKWSDDVYIYPGHGDGCSMKRVREINKEFMEMVSL